MPIQSIASVSELQNLTAVLNDLLDQAKAGTGGSREGPGWVDLDKSSREASRLMLARLQNAGFSINGNASADGVSRNLSGAQVSTDEYGGDGYYDISTGQVQALLVQAAQLMAQAQLARSSELKSLLAVLDSLQQQAQSGTGGGPNEGTGWADLDKSSREASRAMLLRMQNAGLSITGNAADGVSRDLPNAQVSTDEYGGDWFYDVSTRQIQTLIAQANQQIIESRTAGISELQSMVAIIQELIRQAQTGTGGGPDEGVGWANLDKTSREAARRMLVRMQNDGLSISGNAAADGVSRTIADALVTTDEYGGDWFYDVSEAQLNLLLKQAQQLLKDAQGAAAPETPANPTTSTAPSLGLSAGNRTALTALLADMQAWLQAAGPSAADVESRVGRIISTLGQNGLAPGDDASGQAVTADTWAAFLANKVALVSYALNYDKLAKAQAILSAQRPGDDGTAGIGASSADAQAVVEALAAIGVAPSFSTAPNGIQQASQQQFDTLLGLLDQARMYFGTMANLASEAGGGAPITSTLPSVTVPTNLSRNLYWSANFYRTMLAVPNLLAGNLKTSIEKGLADFFGNWAVGSGGYRYNITLTSQQNAVAQSAQIKARLDALDAALPQNSEFLAAWAKQKSELLETYSASRILASYSRTAAVTTGDPEYDAIHSDPRLAGQLEADLVNRQFEELFDVKFSAKLAASSDYGQIPKEITGLRNNLQALRLVGSFLSAGSIADAISNLQNNDKPGTDQYIKDVLQIAAWIASALQVPINTVAQMIIQAKKGDATMAPLNKFIENLKSDAHPASPADLGPRLDRPEGTWHLDKETERTLASFSHDQPLALHPNLGEELGKGAIFLVADLAAIGLNAYSLSLAIKQNNLGGIISQTFSLAAGTATLIGDILPIIATGAKIADASVYLLVIGQVLGLGASGYAIYSAADKFQKQPNIVNGLGVLDATLQAVSTVAGPGLYVATCGLSVFLPNFSSIYQAIEYQKLMDKYSGWGLNHEWQVFDALHKIKALDSTPIINWFSGVYTNEITKDMKNQMTDDWFRAAAIERINYNFNTGNPEFVASLRSVIQSNSNISDVVYLRNGGEFFDYFNVPKVVGLLEGVDVADTSVSTFTSATKEVMDAPFLNWVTDTTGVGHFMHRYTISTPDHANSDKKELVIIDINNVNYSQFVDVFINDAAGKQSKIYKVASLYDYLAINGGAGDDIFILPENVAQTHISINGGAGSDVVSFVQKQDGTGQTIDFAGFTGIEAVVGTASRDLVRMNQSGTADAAQLAADHNYSWGGGGADYLDFWASTGSDTFVLGTGSTVYVGSGETVIHFQGAMDGTRGQVAADNTDATLHAKSCTLNFKELDKTYGEATYSSISVSDIGAPSYVEGDPMLTIEIHGTSKSGRALATTDVFGATTLLLPDWDNQISLGADSYLKALSLGDGNNSVALSGKVGNANTANGGLLTVLGKGRNSVALAGSSRSTVLTHGTDTITLAGQATASLYLDGIDTVDASACFGDLSAVLSGQSATVTEGKGHNAIQISHAGGSYTINDNASGPSALTIIGFDKLNDNQLSVSLNAEADILTLRELKGDGHDAVVTLHGTGINDYIELSFGDASRTVMAADQLIHTLALLSPLDASTGGGMPSYTISQLLQMSGNLAHV